MTNEGGSSALKRALEDEFSLSDASVDVSYGGRTDRSLLTQLLNINGLAESDENFQRLQNRYTAIFPEVLAERGGEVLPGARELLRRLRDHASVLTWAMTGNLVATGTEKLRHFGLLPLIHDLSGGDFDAHRDDLARRTTRNIRDHHGEAALNDMIVIGDTQADVRCGHAIGASVIAVCTGSDDRQTLEALEPLAVLDDLSDVDEVFRMLTP